MRTSRTEHAMYHPRLFSFLEPTCASAADISWQVGGPVVVCVCVGDHACCSWILNFWWLMLGARLG